MSMKNISNKTKRYIQDYTKYCSNELTSSYDVVENHLNIYEGWLTVENAKSACIIEREDKMKDNIESRMFNVFYDKGLLLLESEIHEITYELTKKTNS